MIGGDNTGDSSTGKSGFFSNADDPDAKAKVNFTLDVPEEDKDKLELAYNMPVIQLTYDWQIVKVNKNDDEALLSGAEFLLDGKNKYYGRSKDGIVIWYKNKSFNESDIVKVEAGTYTLTETKAPEGFAKTTETWTVEISSAQPLKINGEVIKPTPTTANGVTKYMSKFTIENSVAYVLPETGGRGVYVYTIGGVLLMLGACLLLYKNKKNKNK